MILKTTSKTEIAAFRRAALNQAIENRQLAYERGDSANVAYWAREITRRERALELVTR